MNNICLIGRIVKDAEVKNLEKNNLISFTIAVPRKINKEKSSFINVNVFRKEDKLSKYLTKGTQVAISGELQVDNVKDNVGNYKTFTKVVAEDLTLLGSGKKETKDNNLNVPFTEEEPIFSGDFPF